MKKVRATLLKGFVRCLMFACVTSIGAPEPVFARDPAGVSTPAVANIEDWYGEPLGREKIGISPNSDTTVVLADDVDLTGRTYRYGDGTSPKNVILIADTIRLNGIVNFDLSATGVGANEDGSSGNLVIFARHFVCEQVCQIAFRGIPLIQPYPMPARPGAAPVPPPHPHFGNVLLGVEILTASPDFEENILQRRLLHDPCLPSSIGEPLIATTRTAIAKLIGQVYKDTGAQRDLLTAVDHKTVYDEELLNTIFRLRRIELESSFREGHADLARPYLIDAINGQDSQVPFLSPGRIITVQDAISLIQYNSDFKKAFSQWEIRWLQDKESRILKAQLNGDTAEIYKNLEEVAHLPDYPIDFSVLPQYSAAIQALQAAKLAAPVLNVEAVTFTDPAGAQVHIDAYAEAGSRAYRLPPTLALLRTTGTGQDRKIGFVSFDPLNPHELEFYVTAELAIDPLLAEAVKAHLTKEGKTFDGAFDNWSLTFEGFDVVPGMISSKSQITVSGTVLQAKLVFPDTGMGLILWSTSGLPMRFRWTYNGDARIGGILRNIPLRRGLQATPPITIDQRRVRNSGREAIQIRYAKLSNEMISRFSEPFPQIVAGAVGNLPLPAGPPENSFVIPPAAVETTYGDFRQYDREFTIMAADDLAEEVSVSNEIAGNGIPGRPTVQSVDLNIIYNSGTVGDPPQMWSVNGLLPSPSPGAVQKRWFLKHADGRTLNISGRVHYVDQSFDDLKPWTENSTVVRVGIESVPQQ